MGGKKHSRRQQEPQAKAPEPRRTADWPGQQEHDYLAGTTAADRSWLLHSQSEEEQGGFYVIRGSSSDAAPAWQHNAAAVDDDAEEEALGLDLPALGIDNRRTSSRSSDAGLYRQPSTPSLGMHTSPGFIKREASARQGELRQFQVYGNPLAADEAASAGAAAGAAAGSPRQAARQQQQQQHQTPIDSQGSSNQQLLHALGLDSDDSTGSMDFPGQDYALPSQTGEAEELSELRISAEGLSIRTDRPSSTYDEGWSMQDEAGGDPGSAQSARNPLFDEESAAAGAAAGSPRKGSAGSPGSALVGEAMRAEGEAAGASDGSSVPTVSVRRRHSRKEVQGGSTPGSPAASPSPAFKEVGTLLLPSCSCSARKEERHVTGTAACCQTPLCRQDNIFCHLAQAPSTPMGAGSRTFSDDVQQLQQRLRFAEEEVHQEKQLRLMAQMALVSTPDPGPVLTLLCCSSIAARVMPMLRWGPALQAAYCALMHPRSAKTFIRVLRQHFCHAALCLWRLQGEAKMEAAALRAQLDEQKEQYQSSAQERQEAQLQIQLLQQELASCQASSRSIVLL